MMHPMNDSQPVVLTPYSPLWPAVFDVERALLARVLGDAVAIEHVGSTAVPGLGAKPVIDMLAGTPDLAIVENRIAQLAAEGYRYHPEFEKGMPERRYFTKLDGAPGRFHLHAVVLGGAFWKRHIAFRDALRGDAQLAQQYWRLKQRLAARFPNDRAAYTDAKSEFIREVLQGSRPGASQPP
jgi:GrpB-like predicted nucleotidyltransferase (UPF0157 family)